MECLPLDARKIDSGDGGFIWIHTGTHEENSFNDQPSYVSVSISRTLKLQWLKDNMYYRACGKPVEVRMKLVNGEYKILVLYYTSKNIPSSPEEVHPDYRETWKKLQRKL